MWTIPRRSGCGAQGWRHGDHPSEGRQGMIPWKVRGFWKRPANPPSSKNSEDNHQRASRCPNPGVGFRSHGGSDLDRPWRADLSDRRSREDGNLKPCALCSRRVAKLPSSFSGRTQFHSRKTSSPGEGKRQVRISTLVARSAWNPKQVAVANGLRNGDPSRRTVIKIAVEEAYAGKRER